jgi:hypothetical protein
MLGELPINESDLFPHGTPPAVEAGMIGWEDEEEVADVGVEGNGGVTLIRVQLYRGKDATSDVKPDEAQGHKILARLNGFPFWCIPPKGLQCYVMFPGGFESTPGAGVIAALPGANPFVQFSKTRAKLDVGEDQDLVIKGRSVTLSTYDNDFIVVGPDSGIMMSDHLGNMVQIKDGQILIAVADGDPPDAKTVIRLKVDNMELLQKNAGGNIAGVKLANLEVTVVGSVFKALTAGGCLGKAASLLTGVQYSVVPGTMSATWSVQP